MYALLGDIPLGGLFLTGPTGADHGRKNDFVVHPVIRGKPVLQDMGQALDTRSLSFFFDETFCVPSDEEAKLDEAFASRSPMALTSGAGQYLGSFVVQHLKKTTRNTTARGAVTRLDASIELIEADQPISLSFSVSGLATVARALLNPLTQR